MPNSGHEIIHDKAIGATRSYELINEAWNAIEKKNIMQKEGTRFLVKVLLFFVRERDTVRRNADVYVRAYGYALLSRIMTDGIRNRRESLMNDAPRTIIYYICAMWNDVVPIDSTKRLMQIKLGK